MRIAEWQDEKPTEPGMYFAKAESAVEDKSFLVRVWCDKEGPTVVIVYTPERAWQHRLIADGCCEWAKVHTEDSKELNNDIFPGTLDQLNKL